MIQNTSSYDVHITLDTVPFEVFHEIAGNGNLTYWPFVAKGENPSYQPLNKLRLTCRRIRDYVDRFKVYDIYSFETFSTFRQNELIRKLLKIGTLNDDTLEAFANSDKLKDLSRLTLPAKTLYSSFIPKVISLWPKLKVFQHFNQDSNIQDIQQLTSLTALEVLKIDQPLDASPEQMGNLVAALPSLRILEFSGTEVNSQTLRALRKKVAGLTNLEKLILSPFNWKKRRPVIGRKELIKFAKAAKVLTNLKTLRICGVKSSDEITQEFAKNLPKDCKISLYLNET